jgi:hypothetical protein
MAQHPVGAKLDGWCFGKGGQGLMACILARYVRYYPGKNILVHYNFGKAGRANPCLFFSWLWGPKVAYFSGFSTIQALRFRANGVPGFSSNIHDSIPSLASQAGRQVGILVR